MSCWAGVVVALTLGWGLWRTSARFFAPGEFLIAVPLWGMVGTLTWLTLLDLLGIPWSPGALVLPAVAAALATLASPRPACPVRPTPWALVAAGAAVAQAALVATRPAFGWDFRYIWGLRGLVFTHAASHASQWLAWLPNRWFHPDYPPAWPDLLAAGVTLGGTVERVAASWSAVFVLALGAACWRLTAPTPPPVRALAVVAATWAPLLWSPLYSGYAEPLLAFLTAAALVSLPGAARGDRGEVVSLALATAALALTKNEGIALAVGVSLAVAMRGNRRAALTVGGAVCVVIAAWRAYLAVEAVPVEPRELAPDIALRQLGELLQWIIRAAPAIDIALLTVWLVVAALLLRARAPALVALAFWGVAVAAAYLTTQQGIAWHLATSLDRVLIAPLPAAIACTLGVTWSGDARRGPDS